MENDANYTVGVVYPEGSDIMNDPGVTPHSFDVMILTPLHIKSMNELDLTLDQNGSAITLAATSATDDYEQRIQLPLRIDESSIKAKYKKKKNTLNISATVLSEAEGQPIELLENVREARRHFMGLPLSSSSSSSAPSSSLAAPSSSASDLYEKYKKMKEGGSALPPVTATSSPPSPPIPPPIPPPVPSTQATTSNPPTPTTPTIPTTGHYDNTKVTVLNHPTDRLQLISPRALVDVVSTCLSIAQRQPSPDDPMTIKSIMESFPSKSQSELCRQLLIQAVKFAHQPSPSSPPVLPDPVKERFVKLAEHQMKKVEDVLEKNLEKSNALVKQGQDHAAAAAASSRPDGSKNVEKRSTHAHAPVFNKDGEEDDNDFNFASWLPSVTLEELETEENKPTVAGSTKGGSLSSVLLRSFKGSEKRNMKKVVVSKADKVGKKVRMGIVTGEQDIDALRMLVLLSMALLLLASFVAH